VLGFLPLVLAGFHMLRIHASPRAPFLWLLAASLVFYAWAEPRHLALLLALIIVNHVIAVTLARTGRGLLLALGVVLDVAVLAVFKSTTLTVPLGLSFITFQLLAYLVDTYRGDIERHDLIDLGLVVTMFPHLVAGPILRYTDTAPQLRHAREPGPGHDLAVGVTLFVAGLFKKVMLADGLAVYVGAVFDGSARAGTVGVAEAWAGALAYTLQLYFDFSGYSDMALGLARMMGIRLPLNFDAPYRAASAIEFWKRWHMTLSRFLFEYLYFPLWGGRASRYARYAGLLVTMAIAGLWHGVGVTFLVWGLLHGVYLVVNHVWREARRALGLAGPRGWWGRPLGIAVTFAAVVVAWTIFRAPTWDAALAMLRGLAGASGVSGLGAFGAVPGASARRGLGVIVVLLAVVWFAPTLSAWLARYSPALDAPAPARWQWSPTPAWGALVGVMAALCLYFMLARRMEFLYFQF
jgi:alginate O-acetyltransferase complex protein AlgI